MGVIINRKICDNFEECPCIGVCPTGAMYFDKEKGQLSVDLEKCISCGKCESTCDIHAVRAYRNEEEKQKKNAK